jgi:hypothetical protein
MKTPKDKPGTPNEKTTEQDVDEFLQWVDQEACRRGSTQPGKLILLELIVNDATLLGRLSTPMRDKVRKAAAAIGVLHKRGA